MKLFLIDFILNRPKTALLSSLLLFTFFLFFLPKLGQDFTFKSWYHDDDPLMKLYENFEGRFGNDDSAIMVIHSPKGVLTEDHIAYIEKLTEATWRSQSIIRVDSLTNYEFISSTEEEILIETISQRGIGELSEMIPLIEKNPEVLNYLISPDYQTAIVLGHITPMFDKAVEYTEIFLDLKSNISQIPLPQNLELSYIGSIPLSHHFAQASVDDMGRLIPFLYLMITLITYLIFRRFIAILYTYLIITVSITSLLGLMSLLGLKINSLSSTAPTVLLTVAIADVVHILTIFFKNIHQGKSPSESLRLSLDKNYTPTLLTSISTALGFLSFTQADIAPITELGISVGLSVLLTWFYTYFLLGPVILLTFKNKTRPRIPLPNILSFSFKPFVLWVDAHRRSILIINFILFCFFLYGGSKIQVDMEPFNQFRADHPLTLSGQKINKTMDWMSTLEIMIEAENSPYAPEFLEKVLTFEKKIKEEIPFIKKTISLTDIITKIYTSFNMSSSETGLIPNSQEKIAELMFFYELGLSEGRSLNEWVSTFGDAIRVTVFWNASNSQESLNEISRIEEIATELGLNARVTGKVPLFHQLTPHIVSSFFKSFFLAIIFIVILMSFFLKSLKLGALTVVPSIFPVIICAGFYGLFGLVADIGTVLVASVTLGIAIDDSIHFLSAYFREKNLGHPHHEIMINISKETYPALLNTSLILAFGFSTLLFGQYIPTAQFGGLTAVALFLALYADFVILPNLLRKIT